MELVVVKVRASRHWAPATMKNNITPVDQIVRLFLVLMPLLCHRLYEVTVAVVAHRLVAAIAPRDTPSRLQSSARGNGSEPAP